MPLYDAANLAAGASVMVVAFSGIMAFLGYRSYVHTGNIRLLFIVMAFLVFVIKSLFVAYNVKFHHVPHDSIELVGAMFDLIIILLLFVPFVTPNPR